MRNHKDHSPTQVISGQYTPPNKFRLTEACLVCGKLLFREWESNKLGKTIDKIRSKKS